MLNFLGNPPFFTLAVFVTCLLLFLPPISRIPTTAVCLIPSRLVTALQLHRIFTFAFFHAGFIHILFNMIAWIFLSNSFEKSLGSLGALYVVTVLFIPFSAIMQTCMAYVLDALASTRFRYDCTVGISGVLFAILVVNVHVSAAASVSFFGFFDVPAKWYPWILAALLQLLSPQLSFLGHLSGILLGYALVLGFLRVLTPSDEMLYQFEHKLRLTAVPLWKPNSSILDISYASRSFLPQTASASSDTSSFFDRCRQSWHRFSSWLTGPSASPERQSFSGHGQTLGGGAQSTAAGRIPPHSRLLQQAAEPLSTTRDAPSDNAIIADSAPANDARSGASQPEPQPNV